MIDEEARERYLADPQARVMGAAAMALVTARRKLGEDPGSDVEALANEYVEMTGHHRRSVDEAGRHVVSRYRRLLRRLAG